MAPLSVIVVGAGIGGPAAAAALAQNGHQVTMVERSTDTSKVGYAFRITPNSDRCLRHLGIDVVEGGAVAANTARMMNSDGKIIFEVKEDGRSKDQGINVFASRPQVNKQLMDAATREGVKIKLGVKVESVDTDKTTVTLADGSTLSADLIVVADGIYSVLRRQLLNDENAQPTPTTGHSAIRFTVDREKAENDPELSTAIESSMRMFHWESRDKRVLGYPVNFNKELSITASHPVELTESHTGGHSNAEKTVAYDNRVSMEEVRSICKEFDKRVDRLISFADSDGFRVWKLVDMDDIPTWSKGNVVLIGDACHPLLAFAFSGASMAIEDALFLATLLPSGISKDQIQERLKIYQEKRRPRLQRVRESGRKIAHGVDAKFTMEYRKFLSDYDAIKEAENALKEHA